MSDSLLPPLPDVIPLVIIEDPAWIDPLVGAFMEAGVTTVEVALRTPHSLATMEAFASAGGFQVGAGTVTQQKHVDQVRSAGATFGLSPWGDPDIVSYAQSLSWPFIPGAATPTEAHRMVSLGCDTVKIFPIRPLGGVGFLSSLSSVLPDTSFLPTGGINEADVPDYLSLSQVIAVGGSWLTPAADMRGGHWDEITHRLRVSSAGES